MAQGVGSKQANSGQAICRTKEHSHLSSCLGMPKKTHCKGKYNLPKAQPLCIDPPSGPISVSKQRRGWCYLHVPKHAGCRTCRKRSFSSLHCTPAREGAGTMHLGSKRGSNFPGGVRAGQGLVAGGHGRPPTTGTLTDKCTGRDTEQCLCLYPHAAPSRREGELSVCVCYMETFWGGKQL